MRAAQENLAPNVLANLLEPQGQPIRTKRSRQAKKVVKKAAAEAAAAGARAARPGPAAGAAAEVAEAEVAGADGPRATSPRAAKQAKLGTGGQALLARCAAVGEEANWKVSPPLGKVQERHLNYSMHAKATRSRTSSSLGMCVQQADGSGAREVDWLTRGVACCELKVEG